MRPSHPLDMWRAVLLAVLVGGCYYLPEMDIAKSRLAETPARSAEAAAMTCEAFGIADCPTVYWVKADCAGGTGFTYDGTCTTGQRFSNGLAVVLYGSWYRISDTVQTHELAHVAFGDGHDDVSIWGPDGAYDTVEQHAPGCRVGDQNTALAAAGM